MAAPRKASISEVDLVLRSDGNDFPVRIVAALVGDSDDSTDRRLHAQVHRDTYAQIESQRLFGISSELRPDTPAPDGKGNVLVELRLAAAPPEEIGASVAKLKAWVQRLGAAEPDDPQLDAASWLASGVGSAIPGAPLTLTLWHYLPELSLDADGAMDDGVAAVVAYLTEGAPDAASALGLDVAGGLLSGWLEASSLDPDRALEIMRRDILNPTLLAVTTDLLAVATNVLINEGTQPTTLDSGNAIVYSVQGDNGAWHGIIEARDTETLIVYSLVPVEIPVDRVIEVLELTVRLNKELSLSSFDLDLDNGEYALRTGVDVGPSADPADAIQRAIYDNASSLDDRLPAIEAFIAGASVADSMTMLHETSPAQA
jgi:hypothetical protein